MRTQVNQSLKIPELHSIERQNRLTFRAFLEATARPGHPRKLDRLFDSYLLAVASSLLYSKILYCYQGNRADFHLVEAMTGATASPPPQCHYLFADTPSLSLLEQASIGTIEQPETSATCIFSCRQTHETMVLLSGPGIKGTLTTSLPLDKSFLNWFIDKKPPFPLGVDLFLITENGSITGLPRTTTIRVVK